MSLLLVSRLAPTPNGQLHWGNLMNFALTWGHVRKVKGKLWLRFDDMDQDRCQPHFAEDSKTVLSYLGITWDEEYSNQPSRILAYQKYLTKIPHYVCDCSRKEIQDRTGGDHHYDGHCRNRSLNYVPKATSIRFISPQGPKHDFVLWRREDQPSYHLTCVHDEEVMGINFVLRGEDLLESTEVQRELSRSMAHDPLKNITYVHHPLILSSNGEKLSKSRGDGELLSLIKQGKSSESIWQDLGRRMGRKLNGVEDLL